MNLIRKLTIDQAKEVWNNCIRKNNVMPFASFEWYNTWISMHEEDWQAYLLFIGSNTLAPFVRKNDLIQFTHSFTDYNDLIGHIDEDVWLSILEFLRQDGVKKIEFENISKDSETTSFFKRYITQNQNGIIVPAKTTPILSLPSSFEEYLETIKPKRRKYKKFQSEYPKLNLIKSTTPEKDIDFLISLLEKDSHKNAFLTPQKISFFKRVALSCRKYAWIQLLTVEDNVISVVFMFTHTTSVMLYNSAFNREKYPNAGTYLILSAIKKSIEEGYKKFNFLIGKEAYKYELGAKDFPLYSISIDF